MARYAVPKVYYQPTLDPNNKTEIRRFKSMIWNNMCNNSANFTLVIPIENDTQLQPQLGEYVRLIPGDVIMEIKKREKVNDENDNLWWRLSGQPQLAETTKAQDAQNAGYFFRYVYNESNQEQVYQEYHVGNSKMSIPTSDIISSTLYEDNLGGFTETLVPEYTWGTTIESKPIITVKTEQMLYIWRYQYPSDTNAVPALGVYPNAWVEVEVTGPRSQYTEEQGSSLFVNIGKASAGGFMNAIQDTKYDWILSEQTTGPTYGNTVTLSFTRGSNHLQTTITYTHEFYPKTYTYRSSNDMKQLLLEEYKDLQGTVPAVTREVLPGHEGYSCVIKSQGDVQTRYYEDYRIGDTITVVDLRLAVNYKNVVTGVKQVIESNGYKLDIQLGSTGATIEQRINKTI